MIRGVLSEGRSARLGRYKEFRKSGLAALAGIQRSYMGDVERGTRNISLLNMVKIADALNLPLSDLIREMERELPRKSRKPLKT